jgi:hypothetical protein
MIPATVVRPAMTSAEAVGWVHITVVGTSPDAQALSTTT